MELKHWERQKGELNQLIMCPTDEMRLYYNYRHTLDVGLSILPLFFFVQDDSCRFTFISIFLEPLQLRRGGGDPEALLSLSLSLSL
jgi:hypothetical protein